MNENLSDADVQTLTAIRGRLEQKLSQLRFDKTMAQQMWGEKVGGQTFQEDIDLLEGLWAHLAQLQGALLEANTNYAGRDLEAASYLARAEAAERELATARVKAVEDLALWREQDSVLQQIAAQVNDEHVTCPTDVLKAVRVHLTEVEAERDAAERERDEARTALALETRRVDIVIAEFDAPWPHSHTVAERLGDPLVWQIHECRAAVEDRVTAAESRLLASTGAQEGQRIAADVEAARYIRDLAGRLMDYPTENWKEACEALVGYADELEAVPAP